MNSRAILLAALLLIPLLPYTHVEGYKQALYPYPVPVYALPPGYKPVKQDLASNGTHYTVFHDYWSVTVPAEVSGGGDVLAASFTNTTHVIAYYLPALVPEGLYPFKAIASLEAADTTAYLNQTHLLVYALTPNQSIYIIPVGLEDAANALQANTPLEVNATVCPLPVGASTLLDAGQDHVVTDAGILYLSTPPVFLKAVFHAANTDYAVGDYLCVGGLCSTEPVEWILSGQAVLVSGYGGFIAYNGSHAAVYVVEQLYGDLYVILHGVFEANGPYPTALREVSVTEGGGKGIVVRKLTVSPRDLVGPGFTVEAVELVPVTNHPSSIVLDCSVSRVTLLLYEPDVTPQPLDPSIFAVFVPAVMEQYSSQVRMAVTDIGAARVYGGVVTGATNIPIGDGFVRGYGDYVVQGGGEVVGVVNSTLLIVGDSVYQLPFTVLGFSVADTRMYVLTAVAEALVTEYRVYEIDLSVSPPLVTRMWSVDAAVPGAGVIASNNILVPGDGYALCPLQVVLTGSTLVLQQLRGVGVTVTNPTLGEVVLGLAYPHGVFEPHVVVNLQCSSVYPEPVNQPLPRVEAEATILGETVFKPVYVVGPGSALWGIHVGLVSILPLGPKPVSATVLFNETEWRLTITLDVKVPVLLAYPPGAVKAVVVDGQPVCNSVEECEALRDPVSGLTYLDPFTIDVWLNPEALKPLAAGAASARPGGGLGGTGLALLPPVAMAAAAVLSALSTLTRRRRAS